MPSLRDWAVGQNGRDCRRGDDVVPTGLEGCGDLFVLPVCRPYGTGSWSELWGCRRGDDVVPTGLAVGP